MSRALCIALAAAASIAGGSAAPAVAQAPADAPPPRTAPAERRETERRPEQRAVRQSGESNGLQATRTIDAVRWQPGAPIAMAVTATAPAGATVRLPALDRTFGAFDVRPAEQPARMAGTESMQVNLVAWDAGPVEVPAVEVTATLADGTEARVALPAVAVELASLLGDGVPLTELASDIRGPVDISTGSWLWWTAAGIAATAALAFTWWLRSRATAPEAEPPLPPAEWARRELDRLEAEDLPRRGEVDGFFVRLSGIVRTYIEGRYAIAAPDRTTQEFLREASGHPDLAGDRARELGRFLRTADMVKFAAARPPEDACAAAMRDMRRFVEQTAPRDDMDGDDGTGGASPADQALVEPVAGGGRAP